MTSPQSYFVSLLKSFKDDNNLDALTEALQLVQQMQIEETASLSAQEVFRNEKMQMYLILLNEIDGKLIPNFNFNDLPRLSVSPPPESGLPTGVDPSSIVDPKIRLEYEQSIVENQQKTARFSFQKKLFKINHKLTEEAESFIKLDFSKKEGNSAQLNAWVHHFITSKDRKMQLMQFINSACYQ